MSNPSGNRFRFTSKSEGPLYMGEKGQGQSMAYSQGSMMMYSLGNVTVNPIPPRSLSSHDDGTRHGSLPVKVSQNSPVFVVSPSPSNGSTQNMAYTHPASNADVNMDLQPQPGFVTNYANLTSWTTKFSAQGSPSFPPPSAEVLSIPMMSGRQSSLPEASAGPIHLTSRMHKASPYHNAFSRMSPLQPKPVGKSSSFHGNQPDAMATVLPMNSSGELVMKSAPSRENRFKRTAEALHKSGLWDVAMKTGNLIKRNQELQKDLDQFKMDALNFLKSVIKNPENRDFIKTVLNNALSAGATERKKSSVMTVVVSAAAAAAAAAIKYEQSSENDSSVVSDSMDSGLGSDGMGSGLGSDGMGSGLGSDGMGSGVGYSSGTVSDKTGSCVSSGDIDPSMSSAGFSHDTSVT